MKTRSDLRPSTFSIFAIAAFVIALSIQAFAGVMYPRLVSRNAAGAAGNAGASNIAVSADGRFAAFDSKASDLVAGLADTNSAFDVFLYDSSTDSIRCLSKNIAGTSTGDGFSFYPVISPDGRWVVFRSAATNLVAGDTNGFEDVFRYDTLTNQIVMVSQVGGNGGNGNSGVNFGQYKPFDISDDGRYVAFISLATNLTFLPDTNNASDIFVRDMQLGVTGLISTNAAGTAATSNPIGVQLNSVDVNLSGDGKYLSFQSAGDNLVSGVTDGNLRYDIFVKNLQTNRTRCVTMSRNPLFPGYTANDGGFGPVMNRAGTRIVYSSFSVDIALPDTTAGRDIFVYDIGLNSNFLVSINSAGTAGGNADSGGGNLESAIGSITADGRYVVFESRASDLDAAVTDTATQSDVFRRDLANGVTEMVSVTPAGTSPGNSGSFQGAKGGAISNDGRFITFVSNASSLLTENYAFDNNAHAYVRDMRLSNTFTIGSNISGPTFANNSDFAPIISRNGKAIYAASLASNLTTNPDTNADVDIFRTQLTVAPMAISDYDGDGTTDFVVFRPTSGFWYMIPNSLQYTAGAIPWGAGGDKIISADFSGDRRADYTVYRPATGTWYTIDTANFNATITPFGIASDIPMPGDYDGDGKADIAVYRPATGTWYIRRSSDGQVQYVPFGTNGDIPVSADLDGDGRVDTAVFRPSDGNWYWLQSTNGQFRSAHFGQAGDKPVAADYDSDGKTDLAVYRAGVWYILESRTGNFRSAAFGLATDVPVPGSYDGDGKADIAVWRPSDGNWYILQSTDGALRTFHFGQTGDIPAAAPLGQ